jgi:hypothetical protein
MRRAGWFIGTATLTASAAYVFIYLSRWEWHRALFVAVVFVAVELAMATALVLSQLSASLRRATGPVPLGGGTDHVRAVLRASPPRRDHFAWLARDLNRTNVFVTALLGGGVLLSAGAWAVDRVAYRTVGPVLDRSLAARLSALSMPSGGLVVDDAELVAADGPLCDEPDLRLLLGPLGRQW